MKENNKPLSIISAVFMLLTVLAIVFTSVFLVNGIKAKANADKTGQVLNLVFFIIFDALTIIVTLVNFIPSFINILKVRTGFTITMLIISSIFLLGSIILLIFIGKII